MTQAIDTIKERPANDSVTIVKRSESESLCQQGTIAERSESDSDANRSSNAPKLNELQQRLLAGLAILPADISLCLIKPNKRPHGANWQKKPLAVTQVRDAIINGITLTNAEGNEYFLSPEKILGYGIVTGTPITVNGERYYVVAVDQDGLSAAAKLVELSNGEAIPKTVTFTSQREGRCQRLLLIPSEYAEHIQTRKFTTASGEELAFRWSGLQSVLPPSMHPETDGYVYNNGCAFDECPIAIAPDWMIELMLSEHTDTEEPTLVFGNDNDTCTSPRTDTCTSSDNDTALDFRTVSHLLPHWNDTARSGWSAFQCPVHTRDGKAHSVDHIHVNQASGKWEAHCGCDRKEIYKEVCRIVSFNPPKTKRERRPSFILLNDGSLIPVEGEDKKKAMAWLAKGDNEAKERARLEKRNGKTNHGGTIPPAIPPNGDGGNGGDDDNDAFNDDEQWNPPMSFQGKLGYWEKNHKTGEMQFRAKCNFDFQIVKELTGVPDTKGRMVEGKDGGVVILIKRSFDDDSVELVLRTQSFNSRDAFVRDLHASFGRIVACNLTGGEINALYHSRLRSYRERGGKKYRLCDRIGQQEDGTWVFPNQQFDANGNPTSEEETLWAFNPNVGWNDYIPCPDIPESENPIALRNLIEAQREFAGDNFMRFLLADGFVAATLNEQRIMQLERFFPTLNACGDPGSGKTIALDSALSLIWGDGGEGMIASSSLSMSYERLKCLGSLPSVLDDPPSKHINDKRELDEFLKRQYNRFPRQVRGNSQEPHSSLIITSNDAKGETLPAAMTRIIGLFFPVKRTNKPAYPNLRKAMREAPGAFRSLLMIGYNQMAVHELRRRLGAHLPTAHDRAADNLALMVWYTQQLVSLAGLNIDVEQWVIQNICPDLNETQSGLNSASDFIERMIALRSENQVGSWNTSITNNREFGRCLALNMPSIWKAIERSGDPPSYSRIVLERVLVELGAVKNQQAKFEADRDSTLAYQREVHKGFNMGENWSPPTKPDPANRRALLIPERLWEAIGFRPSTPSLNPDSLPPEGESNIGNEEVAASNIDYVTASSAVAASVSSSDLTQSNRVTKKELEKVEEDKTNRKNGTVDHKNDNQKVENSDDIEQNLVTDVTEPNETAETPESHSIESVTSDCYFDATQGETDVTLAGSDALTEALTLAHRMNCCAVSSEVETLLAAVPAETIEAAKAMLGDEERSRFETIASECDSSIDAVSEVSQSDSESLAPSIPMPFPAPTYRYAGAERYYGNTFLQAGTILQVVGSSTAPKEVVVVVADGDGERLTILQSDLYRE